jgi:hypothetical protein
MIQLSDKQLLEITMKAVEYLAPYITTITGVQKDTNIPVEYIGTSVFIKYDGHTFIASAKHVADNLLKYDYLFHGTGTKNFPIRGHWVATTIPDADFGIMGCFEEMITNTEKVLDFDDTIFRSNHAKEAYYLVMGYPEKLHSAFDFMNTHQHVLTSVITRLKGIHSNKNGDNIIFELSYSNNNVDPPGMSGSPVWNLNLHKINTIEDWSVEQITLAGIITSWNKDTESIYGTISELITHVMPHIAEKFIELYPRID